MTKNSRFGGGWDGMGGFSIGFAIGCALIGCVLVGVQLGNNILGVRNEKDSLYRRLAELEAENATIECNTRIKAYNEFKQSVAEGFVITLNNGGVPEKELWCNAKPILPRHLGVLVEDARPLGWSVTIVKTNEVVEPITHSTTNVVMAGVRRKVLTRDVVVDDMGEPKGEVSDRFDPEESPHPDNGDWIIVDFDPDSDFVPCPYNPFGWCVDPPFHEDCNCTSCTSRRARAKKEEEDRTVEYRAKIERERAIDNMLKSTERINRNIDEITNLIDKIMCNLGMTTDEVQGRERTNDEGN